MYMWVFRLPTVVLDKRGRITIPAEIRRKLGLKEGTELELIVKGDTIILQRKRRIRARDLLGIAGVEEVNIEDIEKALGETS